MSEKTKNIDFVEFASAESKKYNHLKAFLDKDFSDFAAKSTKKMAKFAKS